ncbi:MAG TPA: LPXTG cell wall anchor domain-containing protein [Thermoanaerobaculia bacterium]|nr:LPXTG cell wall anchor domain-containing protein [Thermoanaerobaculia bacterium]
MFAAQTPEQTPKRPPPRVAPDCEPDAPGCTSVGPTPAQDFLRQALGSNTGDMRAPALLLTLALLVAIVGWIVRRRRRQAEPDE